MSELKIELLGAPVLRQKSAEVGAIDDELRTLIAAMFETMSAAEGIGLAGPQVGVPKRVLVIDLNDGEHPGMALINPRVLEVSGELVKEEEGCLSIPGVSAPVERPLRTTVEALNAEGAPVRIEAEGLLARCLLHEIDHLEGILFIDHLSSLKRSMLVKKYRQQQAEESGGDRNEMAARRTG